MDTKYSPVEWMSSTQIGLYGGLSGFPKRKESEYDAFLASGILLLRFSAALGMSVANDYKKK